MKIPGQLSVEINRYGFATNSGGAGKHRGGLATMRSYELIAEEGTLNLRSDRRDHLPAGAAGGLPGSPSMSYLGDQDGERLLPVMPMETITVSKGMQLVHIAAGGGGYGDPRERESGAVLDDVLDGRITAAFAREVYGVALAADERSVDVMETAKLRAADVSAVVLHDSQQRLFAASNGALRLTV